VVPQVHGSTPPPRTGSGPAVQGGRERITTGFRRGTRTTDFGDSGRPSPFLTSPHRSPQPAVISIEGTFMNDQELVANVIDELFWDPKIDTESIAVSENGGAVTLRGTVGSFRQKREAKKAAERVWGVVSVDNEIDVELMGEQRREDADLRGDVLQSLMLDSLVPTSVDAWVEDGVVTLTGTVDRQYQRDEAELVAGNLLGVVAIENDIHLADTTPGPADVEKKIKNAFSRNAKLDAKALTVATSDGTVGRSGQVRSWDEHDAAVAAAWAAPGVKSVDDLLTIAY
jgi:osmotically-inducible protein OsmY